VAPTPEQPGSVSLRTVAQFPEHAGSKQCQYAVNIRGGVCYFLWSPSHSGHVKVVNYSSGSEPVSTMRPALEDGLATFVRSNNAISILNKVRSRNEATYGERVLSRNPFGIPSNFDDYSTVRTDERFIPLFRSRRGQTTDRLVFISPSAIKSSIALKDKVKVLVSKASPGGDEYPHAVFSAPLVAPKGAVSTETYLVVDTPENEEQAKNLIGYMQTRFFRFLVSLIKTTQNISKGSFAFVPILNLDKSWTDEELYERYGITDSEQEFIESMIRPMEPGGDDA